MKKTLAFAFSLLLTSNVWAADNAVTITAGSGLTLRSRDVGAGVQSLQQILGDTSGAALATAPGAANGSFALPIQGVTGGIAVPISGAITITSGTTTVTQATSSNLKAQVDPLTIATWGLAAASQNVAAPTNGQLVMGQFTTTPTTITTTNVSPLQLDNAGNLLVNIKAGVGSGGTALADEATFTQGSTSTTPMGCFFTSSVVNLTTGQAGVARCTNDRQQMVSDSALLAAVQSPWPAGTNMGGFVGLQANTTGGCTPTRVLSAATTNSTSIKGSAGTVCSITIIQNTATAADFRLYDSASAPTCSSATGVVANYGVQANTTAPGLSPNLGSFGLNFTTGIGFCLTAYDGTDTNNSASVTGIQINIAYK